MHLRRRHWLACTALAVSGHLLALAAVWQPPTSGAQGAGKGGIQVGLGPSGGPAGAQTAAAPAEAEPVEAEPTQAKPAEVEPSETETAEPVEPAEPPAPAETAQPSAAPETAAPTTAPAVDGADPALLAESDPVDAAEPAPTEPAEAPAAETPDAPAPPPSKPVAQKPEPQKPAPETEQRADAPTPPPSKPAQVERAEKPDTQVPQQTAESRRDDTTSESQTGTTDAEQTEGDVAGTRGQAGEGTSQGAGTGPSSAGGGAPGDHPDYLARLKAWLERHKRYPRRARMRRMNGTVTLQFEMTRNGQVVSFKIVKSSGHEMLDEATREMIRRAEPLPPFPDDLDRDRMQLTVPVRFAIR
ncbi:energy transducer TonB [Rhodovibrio salinarum]|uniref:TonB C-terminal domain-containing protein n=1 Tax=Rhodovibrio salinarum TaxID=1087 RepID=A0A934QJ32_9PROT|nr:energy transducer TonB [Rhodovibrio salinarum]MBK1697773.1 hypothetical protein [Rhodovibrio salinarum]